MKNIRLLMIGVFIVLSHVSQAIPKDSTEAERFLNFIQKDQEAIATGQSSQPIFRIDDNDSSLYINGGEYNKFFNKEESNYKKSIELITDFNNSNKGKFFYVFHGRYFFNREILEEKGFENETWDNYIKLVHINKQYQNKDIDKTQRVNSINEVSDKIFNKYPNKTIIILFVTEEFVSTKKNKFYKKPNPLGSPNKRSYYYRDLMLMWDSNKIPLDRYHVRTARLKNDAKAKEYGYTLLDVTKKIINVLNSVSDPLESKYAILKRFYKDLYENMDPDKSLEENIEEKLSSMNEAEKKGFFEQLRTLDNSLIGNVYKQHFGFVLETNDPNKERNPEYQADFKINLEDFDELWEIIEIQIKIADKAFRTAKNNKAKPNEANIQKDRKELDSREGFKKTFEYLVDTKAKKEEFVNLFNSYIISRRVQQKLIHLTDHGKWKELEKCNIYIRIGVNNQYNPQSSVSDTLKIDFDELIRSYEVPGNYVESRTHIFLYFKYGENKENQIYRNILDESVLEILDFKLNNDCKRIYENCPPCNREVSTKTCNYIQLLLSDATKKQSDIIKSICKKNKNDNDLYWALRDYENDVLLASVKDKFSKLPNAWFDDVNEELLKKLDDFDVTYNGKYTKMLETDLLSKSNGAKLKELLKESPEDLTDIYKVLKDDPHFAYNKFMETGGARWQEWSKSNFFKTVTKKGKDFEEFVIKIENRELLKSNLKKVGVSLDDYEIFKQVQMYTGAFTKNEKKEFFIADVVLVKKGRNEIGDVVLDTKNVIVLETKLSKGTNLTTPQTNALSKVNSVNNNKFIMRSKELKLDEVVQFNQGQTFKIKDFVKVWSNGEGGVISGIKSLKQ